MQGTVTTRISTLKEYDRTPRVDWSAPRDKITEQLQNIGQLVLTDENGPIAVMLKVNNIDVEDTLTDLRRLKALRIMKEAQDSAIENGTSNMTLALQGKLQVCYNQAIIEEYDEVLSRPNFKVTFKLKGAELVRPRAAAPRAPLRLSACLD